MEPTLEKIIISLHSRFFGEHDIRVYFNLISPLLSWLHNCDDQFCLHIFLRSSDMIFHIFTCILHYLRVYYELTKWPAPRWLDCSVGRALHRHRRTHSLESRSGQIFFGFIFTILLKLCVELWWSIMSRHLSPQFKYLIFHIFTCSMPYVAN